MRLCICLVLSILITGDFARAAEKEYDIRIHRPDKAGMKFDVAITSALKREVTTTIDGRATREPEEVFAIELKATAEIVEVDDKGRDLKVTYVIEKCVKSAGEKDEEILAKGKVITAAIGEDGKQTVYTLADGQLNEAQKEALDLVADLPPPNAALADELYGPKGPQKIGASWSVNSAALAEDLKRNDFQAKPDAISGSMKLNGLEKANGIQCLNITGDMKVARAKMNSKNEGNAVAIKNATIDSNFSWLLPVDPALNHVVAYGTVVSTYSMGGATGNGGDFKRELKTTRMYEIRAIPLP
jgi:hypothetical protein